MQFRNFFPLLVSAMLLFVSSIGYAQQVTTNENGEQILVYPDGTWRYLEAGESAESFQTKNTPKEATVNRQMPTVNKAVLEALEKAERAAATEAEAMLEEELAINTRMELTDELEDADRYGDVSKDEMSSLKKDLKAARKAEKKAIAKRKKAAKKAAEAEAVVEAMEGKSARNYATEANFKSSDLESPRTGSSSTAGIETSIYNQEGDSRFASFDPKEDVILYPPVPNCELAFDGVDDFSGKRRRDVASQFFFSYTNDDLRSYYKERDFITCHGYVSSLTGGYKFLTLTITIVSETAQRDYGILEKGAIINIKMLDGTTVRLFNNKTDIGKLDPLDKSVSYKAQYIISSSDEKQLRKQEVDKVRMIWSSGYEDYEIYEVDFFIDQLNCLNSKK